MAETPAGTWPDHYLLSFGGSFFGSEVWNCTMRFMDPAGRSRTEMDELCDTFLAHAKTQVRNWLMTPAAGFSAVAGLGWIKFNAIDDRGHYVSATTTHMDKWSPEETGGSASWASEAYCPPDTALAISFHSAYRGPRRANGRIYLPPQMPDLTAGGRIASDALTAIAFNAQTVVDNLNDLPGFDVGTGPRLAVVSRRSETGAAPVCTEVNEIRVGDVLDTQRRRGNKLRESYTKLPVATSPAL